MNRILHYLFLLLSALTVVNAQVIVDKNKGNPYLRKEGLMEGNLVSTVYYNYGEIADWQNDATRSGVWPKGTNHTYIDGVAIIVQAEVQDGQNVFHPLETNYYEYTRHDVATGVTYGWWPLPGYDNRLQTSPAQSNDANTWPSHWPDRTSDWDGYWNGFFGKGVLNADEESYFVFDDSQDKEYMLKYHYYPDSEDSTMGGLGMQVHARGFQWSQVLAEDVIFWHYEITNMSTTDYSKTLFAQYVDWGIGGHDNSSNNAGDYDLTLNLSYAWSTVSYGSPGHWSPVGYTGYAFLESPGISYDFKDNDHDGLTDERRDNEAQTYIKEPTEDRFLVDIQSDTVKFHSFYGYSWKEHWDADENCNWRSYGDLDSNGKWDSGEPLNDDVGVDGIGPLDAGYTAADEGEGDGKPEQGEPNFGILDKDESDQLGLTGFLIAAVHTYDLNNDERNWTAFTQLPSPHGQQLLGVNLANYFSSYLFHLQGRKSYSTSTGQIQETGASERFSMGLIYGLNANDLFRRKKTVQQIYNANYHFAKPPDKPLVKAIAGNHRVTLYWDDRAEHTFDAFYQKYNFEGYRIYRSTEANFLEDKIITDAFGTPTFRQPIAQFDLVDSVKGLHPIGVNGAYFYLGDDSGLQHSFIDTAVQNGQTYYYAVCAYDQGFSTTTIQGEFLGIPPSETTSLIRVDQAGNVKTDVNTAMVTPRAPSAGYIPPKLLNYFTSGPATGSVGIDILDPELLRDRHNFKLEFEDFTAFHNNPNPYYRLMDLTSGDTLVSLTQLLTDKVQTSVIAGFAVNINNDQTVEIDHDKSGWVNGNSNYVVQLGFDSRYVGAFGVRRVNYPADFEITFTEKDSGDLAFPASSFNPPPQPTNLLIKNLTEGTDHFQFLFKDNNNDSLFNAAQRDSDAIFLVCGDSAGKRATTFPKAKVSWSMTLFQDTTIPQSQQRPPQPGDVYRIITKKPYRTGEYVEFTTNKPSVNKDSAEVQMANIAVVPNPYVGAASWEPASTDIGRGPRLIYFIHLPRECTIRIYTISGHLVQEIQHNGTMDNGQESWNLISRDGLDIGFGVYVYQVDAPGIGTHIDKFAVIK